MQRERRETMKGKEKKQNPSKFIKFSSIEIQILIKKLQSLNVFKVLKVNTAP